MYTYSYSRVCYKIKYSKAIFMEFSNIWGKSLQSTYDVLLFNCALLRNQEPYDGLCLKVGNPKTKHYIKSLLL